MKLTCPENCLALLQRCAGEKSAISGGTFPDEFYNTLELFPAYARDASIHAMLLDALQAAPLDYRIRASQILLTIGDPLGILHLTYNSLSVHPLLKARQDPASGWPRAPLLRHADRLTDECIALLLGDLEPPHAFWHMDILAALPAEKIVPRMRAMLAQTGTPAMIAAYVLAMKGDDAGRAVLERLAESQRFLDLAVIALSHIPDYRGLSYLKLYADPDNPIYNRQYANLDMASAQRSGLMLHAQCRLFLLECHDPFPVRRTMEMYYLDSIQAMVAESDLRTFSGRGIKGAGGGQVRTLEEWAEAKWRWIKPPRDVNYRLFASNSGVGITSGWLATGVNAADFLCEFATPADRAHCAEIQRVSIRTLLKVIGWRTLGNGSDMGIRTTFLGDQALPPTGIELGYRNLPLYLPGVEIHYTPRDYERAAVDWIMHPGRYRTKSYWPRMMLPGA